MLAEAVLCMALNIVHEADTVKEPFSGRLAIGFVTKNRADQNGTSVCWEVIRYRQFSWTLDPMNLRALPEGKAWNESVQAAELVLSGTLPDITSGATHFHAYYIHPSWAKGMIRLGRFGSHIFYKEKKHGNGIGNSARCEGCCSGCERDHYVEPVRRDHPAS